jgi:hypothetical protein
VPTIDEPFVDASAPNAAAMKNGRALVQKKSFTKLQRTEDGTLLLGTCKGSGAEPYRCSSDFYDPAKPVHRCTCPSRQFPCKHSLGLMYSFALGKPFEIVTEIPEDIASKREKVQVRAEKKKDRDAQPRKVDTKALAKKLEAQIEGLDLLERLVFDLVRLGMGSTTAKTASPMRTCRARRARCSRTRDSFSTPRGISTRISPPPSARRSIRTRSISSCACTLS